MRRLLVLGMPLALIALLAYRHRCIARSEAQLGLGPNADPSEPGVRQ
jgi:hypothetical protein